ncbi:MAG: aminoglycoside phosphotransferase [Actinomycetia bacterium]|nr:aminoglycoside phosphotransferase [Actinomycetes bacterium]
MDAALGRQPDPAFVEAELTRLLDHAPHGWTAEPLAHNLHNAVTAGIWRVRSDGLTAVLKVLSGAQTDDGRWVGSSDPRDWNYWEREALAYESGLAQRWERFGLRAPRLLESFRRSDGTIALWLEHVDGSTGAGWTIDGLETMVVGLGTAQGELTRGATDELPWTSRRFLRSYVGRSTSAGISSRTTTRGPSR